MLKKFWGKDGFIWWKGVVEDRFDPLQAGRCKVRIFGWHTEDKALMPTDQLPWCRPSVDLDSGRMNVVGPREGAWVWGFFSDGPQAQEPIMIGIIPGIPEKEADPSIGFNDPRPDSILEGHQVPREPEELEQHDDGSGNDIYEIPKKSRFPDKRFLPESDADRLARNEFIEKTIVPLKKENVFIGQADVPTGAHPAGTGTDVASPGTEWTERETQYDAEYPYNHTYFSEGGHIVEIDDTPNKERMHWYHRVGTFKEWDPVGACVEKIVDNEFRIVLEHRFTHIEASDQKTVDWFSKEYVNKDGMPGFNKDVTVGPGGDFNVTLEDGKMNFYINGDCNIYTTGSVYLETDENVVAMVHKELHATVDKSAYLTIKENLNAHVLKDANVQIDGDLRYQVGGDMTGRVSGDRTEFVGGDYKLVVAGNIERYSAGSMKDLALGNMETSTTSSIIEQAAMVISETSGLGNFRTATAEISDTAGGGCFRQAAGVISDTAAGLASRSALAITDSAVVVSHNAATTNCTGILTGLTTDDNGDVTPIGPPGEVAPSGEIGPTVNVLPGLILTGLSAVADAIIVDITDNNAPDQIEIALESILTDAEAAAEMAISAIEGNSNAPGAAGGAAGGAGGGGGGGGGDKGGIPIDGPGGFLWKPEGDNSGVLTVLYNGQGDVAVYEAIPDGEEDVVTTVTNPDGTTSQSVTKKPKYKRGNKIEDLEYVKNFHGDGRGIHRGRKPGSGYGPGPVIASAGGQDYTIGDPSKRHD